VKEDSSKDAAATVVMSHKKMDKFDATGLLAVDPAVVDFVLKNEPQQQQQQAGGISPLKEGDDDDDNNNNPQKNKNTAATTSSPSFQPRSLDIKGIPFVHMFRGSANYIANHRNTLAVYHIPGGLLDLNSPSEEDNNNNNGNNKSSPTTFRDLMNDIALTWLLGMKIVLVAGCRHQINQRMGGLEARPLENGLPITDAKMIRIIKEEAGYVRFEVERQLARALRMQGGSVNTTMTMGYYNPNNNDNDNNNYYSNSDGASQQQQQQQQQQYRRGEGYPLSGLSAVAKAAMQQPPPPSHSYSSGGSSDHYDGNVVSGNFYSAQPLGILDGIDYQYTGTVRRVEVEKIRQLHNNRDICLLNTLGVSPSGEIYNVNSESLAASVAGAMGASKIIYFTESEVELRHNQFGNKIQHLRYTDAKRLLEHCNVQIHNRGAVTIGKNNKAKEEGKNDDEDNEDDEVSKQKNVLDNNPHAMDMLAKIGWSMKAVEKGVRRAHVISPKFGAVLQELYTRDGSGTLISRDLYEGIQQATVDDVVGIHELISPLIQLGTLVDRPRSKLEKDIDSYYVFTRDNLIVACGQVRLYAGGNPDEEPIEGQKVYAEIGCLVVNKDYRAQGRGDAMLGYLERLSLLNGATTIFVLSTQTMEWFIERGFSVATVDQLPPRRGYNHERKSKIYMKEIKDSRDLDQSELWWNR